MLLLWSTSVVAIQIRVSTIIRRNIIPRLIVHFAHKGISHFLKRFVGGTVTKVTRADSTWLLRVLQASTIWRQDVLWSGLIKWLIIVWVCHGLLGFKSHNFVWILGLILVLLNVICHPVLLMLLLLLWLLKIRWLIAFTFIWVFLLLLAGGLFTSRH